MKTGYLHRFAIVILIVAAIFGRVKRNSYTDLRAEENYLDQLMVAELPEEIAINSFSDMSDSLPKSEIILRVSARGDVEYLFGAGRHKVSIEEIYTGDNLEIGEEIYLYSPGWKLILGDDDVKSAELNFVNKMKEGDEYLVFISHKIDALNEPIPIYQLKDDSPIAPIFSYNEPKSRNIIAIEEGDSTYVPYIEVKDNEFFGETEKTFQAWENLKSEMLLAYPIN